MSAALPSVVAGAAAAPATGGLSLLLPLLMSFGPSLLNRLLAGEGSNTKLRRQLNELLSPEMLAKLTQQFYQQSLQSPAYAQAQRTIATGANETGNIAAANLAARGLGTSGTGAILSSLGPSLIGHQSAGLRTAAHTSAQNLAQQNITQRIAALNGTQGPSETRQMFGAGIEAFQPYLQQFLRTRYPSLMGPSVPAAVR